MNTLELKHLLRKESIVLGTWVFEFDSVGLPRLLASTGIDFVVYDMEHSGFGIDTIRRLIAESRPLTLGALVRPPANEYHLISTVLDVGAGGVIIPRVESAAEAARIVDACRYPPQGHRGAAFSVAHDNFLPGEVPSKIKAANDAVICGLLIETERGVQAVDEILSVAGVDLVWVGHLDLSLSMGIPGQFGDKGFKQALEKILSACRRHKLPAGILVNSAEQAIDCAHQGFQCIAYSGDIWLLQRALARGIQAIRGGLPAPKNGAQKHGDTE